MNIISFVKTAEERNLSFENHPAKELSEENKIKYLNGLALLMNVDGEISTDEKEYIGTLIRTFQLPAERMEELVTFAENPNDEAVQDLVDSIKSKAIKNIFLVDCLILAYKDSVIHEKERELIDKFFNLFEIKDRIKDHIYYVHNLIKEQDEKWQFDSLQAVSNLMN